MEINFEAANLLISRINSCDTWLSRLALPRELFTYSLEFQEDWSKVAAYERNTRLIRLLNESNNQILSAERKFFGIEWYNKELYSHFSKIRSDLSPGINSFLAKLHPFIQMHPQYRIEEWVSGTFVSAIRSSILPNAEKFLHKGIMEIYLSGYVPYDFSGGCIYLS